uniref:Gustatory receptor n=1 Tax=Eogystia hippophaecolus TaxID=1206364 RepID=A0A1B3P5T5_EOGHI|nr:gustatory receptor [Eogystia hippophaecolus]
MRLELPPRRAPTNVSTTGWLMVIPVLLITAIFGILCGMTFTAQRVQNNADVLKERVTKILLDLHTDDVCYKAIKGFLKIVAAHPIRTRAFGGVLFNNTLIPTCIGYILTYTVIALQFDNVI